MMTRPKPDSSQRKIVDLSWPHGASVNSMIPDNVFDDMTCTLAYPTVADIADRLSSIGHDALLFKIDLKRAYCNPRIDPHDLTVLGLQWGTQMYVNVSIPFGLKTGASASNGHRPHHPPHVVRFWTCAYLDDIIGVASPSTATSAFLSLNNLITMLGLPINADKLLAPTEIFAWLFKLTPEW